MTRNGTFERYSSWRDSHSLNSKRLKLRHIQHLTSALNLPTTALEVMIRGKISETSHGATSIQVVIVQSEEG